MKHLNLHHSIIPMLRPSEQEWLRLFNGDGKYRQQLEEKRSRELIKMTNPFEKGILIKQYL